MKNNFRILALSLFMTSSFLIAPSASALSLGILGGASLPGGSLSDTASSPALLYGAEATFGTIIDIGAFYERTNINLKASGSFPQISQPNTFYGVLGRINILSFFADVKVGPSSFSGSTTAVAGSTPLVIQDFPTRFSYGLGAGFKYSVAPFFALMPRLGYRNFSGGNSTTDLTMIFAFLF